MPPYEWKWAETDQNASQHAQTTAQKEREHTRTAKAEVLEKSHTFGEALVVDRHLDHRINSLPCGNRNDYFEPSYVVG